MVDRRQPGFSYRRRGRTASLSLGAYTFLPHGRNRVWWKELEHRSQINLQTQVRILAPLLSYGIWGHYLTSLRFSYLIYNVGKANGWKVPGADLRLLMHVRSPFPAERRHIRSLFSPSLNWCFLMPRISGLPSLPVFMFEAQPGPLFTKDLVSGIMGLDFQEEEIAR